MNTVKKCSISGIAFTLDVDAFEALDAYLKSLHTQYADHKDGDEIVADIEARIAELILSAQDGTRTVELPLVQNIIAQMGSPEQIDEQEQGGQKAANPDGSAPTPPASRVVSTGTPRMPSWAVSAPVWANISTWIRSGSGWDSSRPCWRWCCSTGCLSRISSTDWPGTSSGSSFWVI